MPKIEEDQKGHFNAQREITKYKLDHSTFDLIDVDKFHNTKFSTVCGYLWVWILIFLSWALLGVDIYTCLNILVFHRWSSSDYKPYAYSVAKWIFTGCIIFQFCLLLYHWVWAIRAYRTKNIALAYVNVIAKTLYSVRSYNYYCLFYKIGTDNSFDFACFLTYTELDNALQILVADTPRQVINILTLRYYATDGDVSNDIIANIKEIATTNIRLSIILSFMCLSVIIWSIFFFKFILGMLMFIPVTVKLRKKGYKSLKKYCCKVVNDKVRSLVLRHHRPRNELLERGIMDLKELKANPLLNASTTDFDLSSFNKGLVYNDNDKLTETYSLQTLRNPFDDNKTSSVDSFSDREKNISKQSKGYSAESFYKGSITDPFDDSRADLITHSFSERNQSLSSLTYDNPVRPPGKILTSRAQTLPLPQFDRSYSQPDVLSQPRSVIRPETIAKMHTEDPFESVDYLSASDGSTPYPVRGISLYDKNYRRVIRSIEEEEDNHTKKNVIYPLEELDEEKIKGAYPQQELINEFDEEMESDNDELDEYFHGNTPELQNERPVQESKQHDIFANEDESIIREYPDKDVLDIFGSEDDEAGPIVNALDDYLNNSDPEDDLIFTNKGGESNSRSNSIYPRNADVLIDLKDFPSKRDSTLKGMYPEKDVIDGEAGMKPTVYPHQSESADDYDFNEGKY